MSIKLNDCRISRRGKGAKGQITIQTFGKPVKRKGEKPEDPITLWDYSFAAKLDPKEVDKAIEKIAHINEIKLRGADLFLKSAAIRSQSESILLINRIIANGLAMDKAEAKSLAQAWMTFRYSAAKSGMPVPTIDQLVAVRQKAVKALKASGQWKDTNVSRLNTEKRTTEEAIEQTETDSPETDETVDETEETETDETETSESESTETE